MEVVSTKVVTEEDFMDIHTDWDMADLVDMADGDVLHFMADVDHVVADSDIGAAVAVKYLD